MIQFTPASILGVLTFLVGVPAVAVVLCAMPKLLRPALGVMVFATCHIKKPFYMEVFFQSYRGVDRGLAVTVPDLFFFGIALYLLIQRPYRLKLLPYNSLFWFGLILVSCISVANAGMPLYSWFTIHKFFRCWLLYWVIVNVVRNEDDVRVILYAFACILAWQATIVFGDKYITGRVVNRAMGSFNHPNAMAMYLDMLLPIVWCCLLEGVYRGKWQALALIGMAGAFVAVIFTKSRAAIVLMPAMMAGVTGVSIIKRPNMHKVKLLMPAVLAGVVVFAIAMPKIIARFEKAPKESAETRHYFNDAAREMAQDQWLGVGINQYSWALENLDYYWTVYPDKIELSDPEAFRESEQGKSRLGTAHHIYYLFLGEVGWPGLILFVIVITRFALLLLKAAWKAKTPIQRGVLIGMLGSFGLLYIHGLLEWVMRQTQPLYLYFAICGLLVAIVEIQRKNRDDHSVPEPKYKQNAKLKERAFVS